MITTSLELSKRLKEAGFPQDIPNEYGDERTPQVERKDEES